MTREIVAAVIAGMIAGLVMGILLGGEFILSRYKAHKKDGTLASWLEKVGLENDH